jgi:hypothetical protein
MIYIENATVLSRYLVREYCETYLHRMCIGKIVIMSKNVVLTVTINHSYRGLRKATCSCFTTFQQNTIRDCKTSGWGLMADRMVICQGDYFSTCRLSTRFCFLSSVGRYAAGVNIKEQPRIAYPWQCPQIFPYHSQHFEMSPFKIMNSNRSAVWLDGVMLTTSPARRSNSS